MASLVIRNDREFEFNNSDFQFLSQLAYEKTGIVLAENKKDLVYGRIVRRLRALGLGSFKEYCELMQSAEAEDEMEHLINAVTTNLTSFFREAHHFEHLHHQIGNSKKFRVWSSACSSGMEAYSIAMVLKSAMNKDCDGKILATDIDSNMINIGRHGEYNASDVDDVPSEYKQYIKASGKKVSMADELKQLISFKYLNLLNDWPMKGPFDAVFCRNVMIYFDKPTKQRLIDRMANLIKPDGWLYIGHSENLHGISDRFELVGRTIYRRIK